MRYETAHHPPTVSSLLFVVPTYIIIPIVAADVSPQPKFIAHAAGAAAAGAPPAAFFPAFGRFTPYLDRLTRRFSTPVASNVPRTIWYRTPGRSFTRPPRTSTIECSCRLCPSSGIYAITSNPFVRRTFATLRSAEFGFFGVVV